MKRFYLVSLFLVILTFCFANATRVHISELSMQDLQRGFVPDMDGYVLIADTANESATGSIPSRPLPDVYPGWPVSFPNSNNHNGAIYLNMDDDPEMEVVFGVGTRVVALKLDGTPVPGWPQQLSFFVWGSPAAGDITGDGIPEIVVTSRNSTNGNTGALYAFHLDGTTVDGFPITQSGGGTMNACLADITGDGIMEILVNVRSHPDGWTYIYDGTGAVLDGWPQTLDTFPGAGISSGDITGDGNNEVISLSYNSLHVFDNTGNLLDGFPVSVPGITYSYSSPVLVDLDNTGEMQIVYGGCSDSGGAVFVVNPDGSFRDGWPQYTGSWIFATVSIADVNGDGELDIIVGDQVGSAEPSNYIYVWDKDGDELDGFPTGPMDAIYTQIGVVDITGNGNVNLIITSNLFAYGYDSYNHDGTHTDGWPLPCGTDWSSVTMQSTPVFGDLNGDGNIDMVGAATGFMTWLVELYVWGTDVPYNEDLAFMIIDGCDIQHSGVFVRPEEEIYTVATPEFYPEPGYYEDFVEVEITCETEDALIYYTLDESEPTEESLLYTEPLYFDHTVTITARAFREEWLPSEIVTAEYEVVLAVDDIPELSATRLRAYPNPFNPETTIEFTLPRAGKTRLTIYNTRGQRIKTLHDEYSSAGEHSFVWNGQDDLGKEMPSGVYYYKLVTGSGTYTNKMLLLK